MIYINMNVSYAKNININFGTTVNKYYNDKNQIIRQNTYFARSDLNWNNFIKILDKSFENKNHVNIYSLACSDGSEPITTVIFLDKYSKNNQKYFPIFASDINKETISKLNKNRGIEIRPDDFDQLKINHKDNPYFEEITSYSPTKSIYDTRIICKLSPLTKKRIKFSAGNLLDKLENINDNGNTVIMCRNVLPYFYDNRKVKNFAEMCNKKLKENSIVVIGDYDNLHTCIHKYLKDNNFKKIETNIYQKKEEKHSFISEYFHPSFLKKN